MIMLNSSDNDIKQLKSKIAAKVRHPYLVRFIPEPHIDDDKLVILSSIMNHTTLPVEKKEQYIITTMLVQIALDTHDLVTLTDDEDDKETVRHRQLTVLAGDYFSGLYYYLLSQLNDIPMIHTLAGAIKEINELKMELYYKDVESFQEFLDGVKKIESLLIQRVGAYVQKTAINDMAGEWLLAKKLMEEKRSYQEGNVSPLIEALVKRPGLFGNHGQVIGSLEQMVQSHVNHLEAAVAQLPIHFNWLKSYVHAAIHHQFNHRQIAEEG
ncbi:heptaprenyl diphosphate synthase component 1 [Halobacillus kuroshimensis]|uniref:Heptaprenyl diphosphate synthase component 1 n=2 Tax=Bacillaceae TaxID=186817 RepID=A0ABS3DTZ0_9BACI|nr:heptaprenyl diphosphate synthase component 1 [Halobacillus kuroshimensis]